MAFKFKTFAAVGALIGSLALVGCGQDEKGNKHGVQIQNLCGSWSPDRFSGTCGLRSG